MVEYSRHIEENRRYWDELAEHHPNTDHYDVPAFLAGTSTLRQLEREELDVEGKRILHLQCHFGMDTISWVRNAGAAHATGVDFSPTAIDTARQLREEVGLSAETVRFIESDIYALSAQLEERFDVVVTTYGTIYWLPDLDRWAEVVAHHVDAGGEFYMADGHPFAGIFHHESTAEDLRFAHPYFPEEPITEEGDGSYAGWDFGLTHQRSHGFAHPLGAIVTALANAGLELEFVHEFPWSFFQRFDAMEADADGRWWLADLPYDLPFTFSLKTRRPA